MTWSDVVKRMEENESGRVDSVEKSDLDEVDPVKAEAIEADADTEELTGQGLPMPRQ